MDDGEGTEKQTKDLYWTNEDELNLEASALSKLHRHCIQMIGGDNNNNDHVDNGIMNNRMLMMAVGRAILPLARTLVLLLRAAYSAIRLQHKMIRKERRINSSSSLVSCSSLPVPSSSLIEENELLSSIVENETLMSCNDGFHIVRLLGGPRPTELFDCGATAATTTSSGCKSSSSTLRNDTTTPLLRVIDRWLASVVSLESHHGSRGKSIKYDSKNNKWVPSYHNTTSPSSAQTSGGVGRMTNSVTPTIVDGKISTTALQNAPPTIIVKDQDEIIMTSCSTGSAVGVEVEVATNTNRGTLLQEQTVSGGLEGTLNNAMEENSMMEEDIDDDEQNNNIAGYVDEYETGDEYDDDDEAPQHLHGTLHNGLGGFEIDFRLDQRLLDEDEGNDDDDDDDDYVMEMEESDFENLADTGAAGLLRSNRNINGVQIGASESKDDDESTDSIFSSLSGQEEVGGDGNDNNQKKSNNNNNQETSNMFFGENSGEKADGDGVNVSEDVEYAKVSRAPIVPFQPSLLAKEVIGPGYKAKKGYSLDQITGSRLMYDMSHLGLVHNVGTVGTDLIQLPESFVELYGLVNRVKGEVTDESDDYNGSETAICLLTGSVMRSGSLRRSLITPSRPHGSCTVHARKVGSGIGVFFLVQKCTVLLMHNNKSAYSASLYVDEHGEEDPGLRRGRPLFLKKTRYESLKFLWRQHGIPREVAQIRSTSDRVIRDNWY
mmetsp:Transcript_2389/g.2545  ORF Transcript_2389/g.2545 Transcript_2389/m.2545 type:complete len:717 (+) Transcript_2389:1-2151(+)